LSTTTSKNQETLKANIKQLMKDASSKAQEVKKMLSAMQETTRELRSSDGESAVVRIREQQHANLSRKFLNYMKTYQSMQEEYQTQFKTRMKRTIRIVNDKVTEEEVDELISKPEITPQDLYQAELKLTDNQKHTLDATYAEVVDTHNDILELERAMNEVHQLFMDFATILAEQEELIDSIAHNVMKANEYVEKGIDNLKGAKKYQKRSRKVYCILILVIILVLVGVAIAVAIVLGVIGGLKYI
jgi:t-SNARE complex subunit (syntaxin)